MREDLLIRVTADPLDIGEAVAFVADPGAGGTCVFLGTVRDHSEAGEVTGLTYEAWEELAAVRLKEDVPIWKKEHLVAGEAQWVMGA